MSTRVLALILAAGTSATTTTQALADFTTLRQPTLAFASNANQPGQPQPDASSTPASSTDERTGPRGGPPGGPPAVSFFASLKGTLGFKSDLKDTTGSVSVSRITPELGVFARVGQQGRLIATLNLEYSTYNFDGPTGLVPANNQPWEDVFNERLTVIYTYEAQNNWEYLVGANIGFTHADGANLGKSLTGGLILGTSYQLNPKLKLGLGVGIFTQLEDNIFVIPIPIVEYKATDKLTIGNRNRPGVFATYDATDQWQLTGGISWSFRDFRLAKNGLIPDGVGKDRRFPLEFGAIYNPSRRLSLEATAGIDLGIQYRVLDSNGNEIANNRAKPAPFVRLGATLRF